MWGPRLVRGHFTGIGAASGDIACEEGGRASDARAATLFNFTRCASPAQAVKLLPHPHPPVALGLLKVNPEPCIELT